VRGSPEKLSDLYAKINLPTKERRTLWD
jgi:hypothetical protein